MRPAGQIPPVRDPLPPACVSEGAPRGHVFGSAPKVPSEKRGASEGSWHRSLQWGHEESARPTPLP